MTSSRGIVDLPVVQCFCHLIRIFFCKHFLMLFETVRGTSRMCEVLFAKALYFVNIYFCSVDLIYFCMQRRQSGSKSGGLWVWSEKFSISSEKLPIFNKKFRFSRKNSDD